MRIIRKIISLICITTVALSLFNPAFAISESISQIQIVAGENHVSALNLYGRVMSAGDNTYGQCNTWNWTNIKEISAGRLFTAGLRLDGTVVITSDDYDVSEWENIEAISCGGYFIAGLTVDGEVLIEGTLSQSETVATWENIIKISAGDEHLVGLKTTGHCVAAGEGDKCDVGTNGDNLVEDIFTGKNTTIMVLSDGTIEIRGSYFDYSTISSWTNVKKYVPGNLYTMGLLEDGTIVTDAPNDSGTEEYTSLKGTKADDLVIGYYDSNLAQEHIAAVRQNADVFASTNFADRANVLNWNLSNEPLEIVRSENEVVAVKNDIIALTPDNRRITVNGSFADWTGVIAFFSGYNTSMVAGLKSNGTVLLNTESYPEVSDWKGIVKVAVGDEHIVGLRWNGTIVSTAGYDIGNNAKAVKDIAAGDRFTAVLKEDGKVSYQPSEYNFFIQGPSNKGFVSSEWTNIIKISAGYQHLVGLKSDGTLVSAGRNFDGRCNVSEFTDVKDVVACEYGTLVLKNNGTVSYVGSDFNGVNNVSHWRNVAKLSAYDDYSAALMEDGTLKIATSKSSYNSIKSEISTWNVSLKKAISVESKTTENGLIQLNCYVSGDTRVALYEGNKLVAVIKTEEAEDSFYMTERTITYEERFTPDKIKLFSFDNTLNPREKAITYIYDGGWDLK